MDQHKKWYVLPWIGFCFIGEVHSLLALVFGGFNLAWLGALIATAPITAFFMWVARARPARTSRHMPIQQACVWIGIALVMTNPGTLPLVYSVGAGALGLYGYLYWFSALKRPAGPLRVGELLPPFELRSTDGIINNDRLLGRNTLMLFYRGNWCPLCVAQIEEVSGLYRQLDEYGADVVLVSTQSADDTEKLAKRFDVPMLFGIDDDLAVTRAFQLLHEGGKPAGTPGGAEDTVMPTLLVADADNRIVWLDETDNYRVRPEPAVFLEILQRHQLLAIS